MRITHLKRAIVGTLLLGGATVYAATSVISGVDGGTAESFYQCR